MRWDNEVSKAEINEGFLFICLYCSAVFLERFNLSFSLYSTELCGVTGYYNPQSHKAVHALTSEYSTVFAYKRFNANISAGFKRIRHDPS